MDCDQVFCLTILNLDHDFTYQEYVPRIPIEKPQAQVSAAQGSGNGNNNVAMGAAAAMGAALGLTRQQQQALMNAGAEVQHGLALNNNRLSSAEVDADAAFKSGLDMGLPLLDLDNFDDDADLDFFLNVLK